MVSEFNITPTAINIKVDGPLISDMVKELLRLQIKKQLIKESGMKEWEQKTESLYSKVKDKNISNLIEKVEEENKLLRKFEVEN